jgi:hypothetical protein
MNVAGLFMRALDNRGDVYLPYSLEGNFTPGERAAIESALRPHVPEKVDAMFNNWRISKFSGGYFHAMRATWDTGMGADSAQEMAEKITKYYNR